MENAELEEVFRRENVKRNLEVRQESVSPLDICVFISSTCCDAIVF